MDEHSLYQFALSIFDAMPGFIAVDADGKIVFMRKELSRVLGVDRDEVIGQPVSEVISNSYLPGVMERGTNEWGQFYRNQSAATGQYLNPALYNRTCIKSHNDPSQIIGAVEFIAVHQYQDEKAVVAELEYLRQKNEMYRKYISEMYQSNDHMDDILGISPKIKELKELIQRVAGTSASVCISGETGTGKELVANAIHKLSKRANGPFIKINCAAIPKDLMESELFGYEAGAFTGAARQGKIGMFELANGGTLLLDEIGELPLDLQAKLLRVLQEQEITRIGGTKTVPIDVRVVCSTNRRLSEMVSNGQFRADLYYRINTMDISVPPLRERTEDIQELTDHFIRTANKRNGLAVYGMRPQIYPKLSSYHWPGNVRELEHCIERACIMCGAGLLEEKHFSSLPISEGVSGGTEEHSEPVLAQVPSQLSYRAKWEKQEADKILAALDACSGNRLEAAKMLQISKATLFRKIKKYNLSELI